MSLAGTRRLLGWFGGSFDPVHEGHLQTAQELLQRLPLAQLSLLPAARSPLKAAGGATAQQRLHMLQLAIAGMAGLPGLCIDDRELQQPPPSYTINTLRALRAQYGPTQPLLFVMGMDSYASLPQWRDWQQLTDVAHLLVVSRPGEAWPDDTWPTDPQLRAWTNSHRCADAQLLEYRAHGLLLFLRTTAHAVSSTAIRAALHQGTVPVGLPAAVAAYIQQQRLYGATPVNESCN